MTTSPRKRAGGTGHPPALPASGPAQGGCERPGAEGGRPVSWPAARVVPAAGGSAGRDDPSRVAEREGNNAGPAVGTVGPAQSPVPEGSPLPRRGVRDGANPPASSRTAPAAAPETGGRGTHAGVGAVQGHAPAQTSPSGTEGSPGRDEGGEPTPRRRTPGEGSPPAMSPAGGWRSTATPPAAAPLSGEDFRRAWKAAESAKNAAGRRGRARRPNASTSPGVGRLRVAAPRPEAFDAAPPPEIKIRPPEPPPEAA